MDHNCSCVAHTSEKCLFSHFNPPSNQILYWLSCRLRSVHRFCRSYVLIRFVLYGSWFVVFPDFTDFILLEWIQRLMSVAARCHGIYRLLWFSGDLLMVLEFNDHLLICTWILLGFCDSLAARFKVA